MASGPPPWWTKEKLSQEFQKRHDRQEKEASEREREREEKERREREAREYRWRREQQDRERRERESREEDRQRRAKEEQERARRQWQDQQREEQRRQRQSQAEVVHFSTMEAYFWDRKRKQLNDRSGPFGNSYDQWSAVHDLFRLNPRQGPAGFPQIHHRCTRVHCFKGNKLLSCAHDVEEILRGSGDYSETFLKRQRLRWHTDRWHAGIFGEEIQQMAQDYFVIIG